MCDHSNEVEVSIYMIKSWAVLVLSVVQFMDQHEEGTVQSGGKPVEMVNRTLISNTRVD